MPRTPHASPRRHSRRSCGVLILVFAVVAFLALGPGTALAGGPTSVLVVSPEKGVTASAYTSDAAYAVLMRALESNPTADEGAPVGVTLGPGDRSQVNVTWLIHDIRVWRVDRILLDQAGVWINTRDTWKDDAVDLDGPGVWHLSPQPKELLLLLKSWGMLDGAASVPAGSAPQLADESGTSANVAVEQQRGGSGPSASSGTQDSAVGGVLGTSGRWWLALPILLLGVLGGALGRPAASRVVRRAGARAARPRQRLIDA
jgi:hypothetical protein